MTILELLRDKRIFDIGLSDDKTHVEFVELCDDYFEATLGKDAFGLLIQELEAIYAQMKDE